MLHVYFGRDTKERGYVFNPDKYFNYHFDRNWFNSSLNREMIASVDKSIVKEGAVIDSPVLGLISPMELSKGVKTLILMNERRDKVFNATACGDNCAKWVLKLSENVDLTINLRHIMDFGSGKFTIHILNNDTYVHNMLDFIEISDRYL